MIVSSDTHRVRASGPYIYDFLNDFTNFGQLLPEQVTNWEATNENCSFTIEGLARISLEKGPCSPPVQLSYISAGKAPIRFSLEFEIKAHGEQVSDFQISLNADLNPMLEMMAKRPLQNFVDILAVKLQEVMELPRH